MSPIQRISLIIVTLLTLLTGCQSTDDSNVALSYHDVELTKEAYNYVKLELELVSEISRALGYTDAYRSEMQGLESVLLTLQSRLAQNGVPYPDVALDFGEYDWSYLSDMSGYYVGGYYVYDFEDWFYEVYYAQYRAFEVGYLISADVSWKMAQLDSLLENRSLANEVYTAQKLSASLNYRFEQDLLMY